MAVKTRAQINSEITTLLPDNTSQEISPADLRTPLQDLADSAKLAEDLFDGGGKIQAALLPSYVDDVLEYANLAAFPGVGETGKIYVTLDTNKTYRWSGSAYVEISASPGSTDAVTEGATNKYYTDTRVRAAVLTGLSLVTNAAITAADTVLSAMGKLQKQITDLSSSVATILGWARREVLVANRTYYVRTDGNDSNTGLVNNAGGAFLTIQKALDTVAALDISIFNVFIQVADGTYTGACTASGPRTGSGTVTLQGNAATPANVLINVAGADCITVKNKSSLIVKDCKLTGTGNYCIYSRLGGYCEYSNIDFGAVGTTATTGHVFSEDNAMVVCTGNYTISGSAPNHWRVSAGIIRCQGFTVSLTGAPSFSAAFANARNVGDMVVNGNIFVGSATGVRYDTALNSVIQTAGGGATYLPGNAASVFATGGQYA